MSITEVSVGWGTNYKINYSNKIKNYCERIIILIQFYSKIVQVVNNVWQQNDAKSDQFNKYFYMQITAVTQNKNKDIKNED